MKTLDEELKEILYNFAAECMHSEFHLSTDDCSNELDIDETQTALKALFLNKVRGWIPEKENLKGVWNPERAYREGRNVAIFEITAKVEEELA